MQQVSRNVFKEFCSGRKYFFSLQIESLLDEATAELAKIEFAPLSSTAEASFKLKKPVPLHTTVRVDCKVKSAPLYM